MLLGAGSWSLGLFGCRGRSGASTASAPPGRTDTFRRRYVPGVVAVTIPRCEAPIALRLGPYPVYRDLSPDGHARSLVIARNDSVGVTLCGTPLTVGAAKESVHWGKRVSVESRGGEGSDTCGCLGPSRLRGTTFLRGEPMISAGKDGAQWYRSSACVGGECVEISATDGGILLRRSRTTDSAGCDEGAVLEFSSEEWEVFTRALQGGEFNDLLRCG